MDRYVMWEEKVVVAPKKPSCLSLNTGAGLDWQLGLSQYHGTHNAKQQEVSEQGNWSGLLLDSQVNIKYLTHFSGVFGAQELVEELIKQHISDPKRKIRSDASWAVRTTMEVFVSGP